MSGEIKEDTKEEQCGENWHGQYEKAYDKQAMSERKRRQVSMQKGEKWVLDIDAQITASCNTVAYVSQVI